MTHAAGRSVLLADDNEDGADSLAAFIELLGFRVRVARNGIAAVEAAVRELPEVAILDLGMPGLDGWEVCRRIRLLPGGRLVRLVALTGWGSDEARRKSADAGFDAHWTKPADPASLLSVLLPDAA
jgi:CheY-like chemotaxis protein